MRTGGDVQRSGRRPGSAPDQRQGLRAAIGDAITGRRAAGGRLTDARHTPPRASLRFRADIQGLRAIAVLLVALNHAGISFLKGGYVGVDVFFVLSGFLITELLFAEASKPIGQGLVDFYSRRARRILPAAALTLVATDIVANQLLNFVRAKEVLQDSIPASLFVANIHFASQGANYFALGQPASPIQHFWSLAVEEQFYIVWPLLLLALAGGGVAWRRRSRSSADGTRRVTDKGRRRVLAAVTVIGVASLAWSIYDSHSHPASAYFSTLARAWELALGAALALAGARVGRVPAAWRAALGWIGLLAIVAAAVAFSASTSFPGYAALLPTVGAALVIGAGIGAQQARASIGRVLSVLPLRFIGDRSYTFYLWHWPVLIIAAQYKGHALSLGTNLLLLLGAFALSVVTYAVFENPLRRARWTATNRALVLWPACVLAVVLVAGYQINHIEQREALLTAVGAPQYPGSQQATSSDTATLVAPSSSGSGHALPAVTAAVAQVRKGAALPQVLHPPVSSVLADHYSPAPGCEASGTQTSSAICRQGDLGSHRTIAIIGDSDAEMWIPDLVAIGRRYHWAILPINKSSCTPPDWYVSRYQSSACTAWYQWMQGEVAKLHPDVTLVTGSFMNLDTLDGPPALMGLTSLLQQFEQSSRNVGVIGDTIRPASQPVDCLLASHATMRSCATPYSSSDSEVAGDVATATQSGGGRFIDPTGWFCAGGYCPAVIGDTIVYRDSGGHVTKAYGQALGDVFRAAVVQAFPDISR
jgi:peptidoglycan/LPS O-acetylase OafA/YrhL